MDSSGTDELQAHVAAWHNRHRWAERIAPAQVSGVGVVSLPFQPGIRMALSARVAALWARCRRQPAPTAAHPVAAFTEDFIAPLRRAAIERFARRHGGIERPGTPDWPERQVAVDADSDAALIAPLYLQTACIEAGRRRRRVLIGVGKTPAVLGARLLSAHRIGITAAMALTLGSTVTVASIGSGWFDGEVSTIAAVPTLTPPAPAAAVAQANASNGGSEASAGPMLMAAAATDDSHAEAHGAAKHVPAAPVAGSRDAEPAIAERNAAPADDAPIERPSIRPVLSDSERAAALAEGRRMRALKPLDAATAAAVPGAPAASAAGDRSAGMSAPRDSGANAADLLYAVASLPLPTKALSQQRQRLIASSVEHGELPGKPRSEIMRTDAGWRVVLWPFGSRADANNARAMLGERGVPTEVLEF
jgi:hypothetical protein